MESIKCSCIICKKVYSYRGINTHYLRSHTKRVGPFNPYDRTSKAYLLKAREASLAYQDRTYGEVTDIEVQCYKCSDSFFVTCRPGRLKDKYSCSMSCSNSKGPRSEETKQKIRDKLSLPPVDRTCAMCPTIFKVKNSATVTCSKQCAILLGNKTRAETGFNERTSKRQSLNNSGGRCKWYEVAGQKLQGTWERDIALYFEENGIKWYKPVIGKDIWKYTMNGNVKSYTPDFYLPEHNLYLEVKGYWWGNDKEKMETVMSQHKDKKIVMIFEKEYKEIIAGNLKVILA